MKILLINFGSFYFENIKDCLNKLGVKYSESNYDEPIPNINENEIVGVILSGGPGRVNNPSDPQLNPNIFKSGIPILGICYGMQTITKVFGGLIEELSKRDLGKSSMHTEKYDILNKDIMQDCDVHMAHYDHITKVPSSFEILANTDICIAMIQNKKDNIYAVQYHPEATQSIDDIQLFKNFVFDICKYV